MTQYLTRWKKLQPRWVLLFDTENRGNDLVVKTEHNNIISKIECMSGLLNEGSNYFLLTKITQQIYS